MSTAAWLVVTAVISYFLGSFPTAYFVSRRLTGQDIRRHGSGNVGGMNTYELTRAKRSGRQAALGLGLVLIGDVGKGVLAIYITRWLAPADTGYLIPALTVASTLVILGHNYPVWFRFREGGIGFATMMGILLALAPTALGVWGTTMVTCIFTAHAITSRGERLQSFQEALQTVATQIPGRLAGLGIALIFVYLWHPNLLLPTLGPTVLILVKHAPRIRAAVTRRSPGK
jgi:glycerol-3-phosphate acyltransferase PlsY